MAQARLSPQALAGLDRLRRDAAAAGVDLRCREGNPDFRFIDRDLGRFLDPRRPPDLALLGSWADGWRTKHPETAAWHFIELDPRGPLDALAVDNGLPRPGLRSSADRPPAGGGLPTPAWIRVTRLMALCFLVHLVADAHQPLHCAGMDGDHGGNRRAVFFRGQLMTLHAAWDQGFLDPGRSQGRSAAKRGKRKGDGPAPSRRLGPPPGRGPGPGAGAKASAKTTPGTGSAASPTIGSWKAPRRPAARPMAGCRWDRRPRTWTGIMCAGPSPWCGGSCSGRR